MASAIGWYIHATRKGYQDHGITTDGKDWNRGWQTYAQIKSSVEQRASKLTNTSLRDREQLTEGLQFIMNDLRNSLNQEDGKGKKLQSYMEEKFKDDLQKVDWDTFDVTLKNPQSWYVGKSKLEKSSNLILDESYILRKMEQLETALTARYQANALDENMVPQVEALREEYKKQLDLLRKDNSLPTELKAIPKRKAGVKTKLGKIRSELIDLITLYAKYPSVNLQKGELFEQVVGYIGEGMQAKGYGAVTDVVVSGLKGQEDVTYDLTQFENLAKNEKTFKVQKEGASLVCTGKSQGKVDVSFSWKEKEIRASVKNYNLTNHWIHLLSDSSLAYLLQYEDKDFTNHFLNLLTTHESASSSDEYKDRKTEILLSMKLLLFYKGLTGDGLGTDRRSANLFIVNDAATGQARVYSMKEIIQKAQKTVGRMSVRIDGKDIAQMRLLANNWVGDPNAYSIEQARVRIGNVLQELHSRKVSVMMNTAIVR